MRLWIAAVRRAREEVERSLPPKTSPALQAADLLAYEARKEFSERVYGGPPKPSRPQWMRLYAGNSMVVRHFDRDALSEYVDVLRDMPWEPE